MPPLLTQASLPCLARSLGSSNEFFKRVEREKKNKKGSKDEGKNDGPPYLGDQVRGRVSQGGQYWGGGADSQHLAIEHPLLSSQGLLEHGLKFRYLIFCLFVSISVQRYLDWRGDQNYC